MTRPHSTHHDDCGCLSERHQQQLADANAAIKRLREQLDDAHACYRDVSGLLVKSEQALASAEEDKRDLAKLLDNERLARAAAEARERDALARLRECERQATALQEADSVELACVSDSDEVERLSRAIHEHTCAINRAAALSRPPGGSEALRAWADRAARLAVECFERNECDFVCMGGDCLSTDPERVKACLAKDRDAFFAAIVARLLGPRSGDTPGGVGVGPQATEEGGAK